MTSSLPTSSLTGKAGDFWSYFEKKASKPAVTIAGTLPYMSPQQRRIISGKAESYDTYKSDVFSLGVTTLTFASVTLLVKPWPLASLSQAVETSIQELRGSALLKDLLRSMLAYEEGHRPTIQ